MLNTRHQERSSSDVLLYLKASQQSWHCSPLCLFPLMHKFGSVALCVRVQCVPSLSCFCCMVHVARSSLSCLFCSFSLTDQSTLFQCRQSSGNNLQGESQVVKFFVALAPIMISVVLSVKHRFNYYAK